MTVQNEPQSASIGIRMNRASWLPSNPTTVLDDEYDVLLALRGKESVYKARTYFSTSHRSSQRDAGSDRLSISRIIVPECREKMCEWCYILSECGQFPSCREMVAVAFSFLDRYMMKATTTSCELVTTCDRTTFKLAAVTSFYLATKILSTAQISIQSLVELGRGEYSGADIQDMEKALLEKLEWRMSPPTVQSFIRQLMSIFTQEIPLVPPLCEIIFQRAIFFAELSVYDHRFIGSDRYAVAVSCLLCSMEALDDEVSADEKDVLRTISSSMSVDQDRFELEKSQARLWYLYSQSAENVVAAEGRRILPLVFSEKHRQRVKQQSSGIRQERSPLSVRGIDCIKTVNQVSLLYIQSQCEQSH